jgi:ligand-binding SRPBCC domain-containing protein
VGISYEPPSLGADATESTSRRGTQRRRSAGDIWLTYASGVAYLKLRTVVDAPVEACFDLSLSVDAHTESMRGCSERAVAGITEGQLSAGQSVTWEAWHFHMRFRMTVRVTEHDPPFRFVDEQLDGPFSKWWHEHIFVRQGRGTEVLDNIAYRVPLGPIGWLIDRLFLRRYMSRIIEERNRWLKGRLESSSDDGRIAEQ